MRALLALGCALSACAVAAPAAGAADPLEAVRAALITTDPAIESGRFSGTMNERGIRGKNRVISRNRLVSAFNLGNHGKFSRDDAISVSMAKFAIRIVAFRRTEYIRAGGTNFRLPMTAEGWYKVFHSKHYDAVALTDQIVAPLSDWRDDGAALTSEGVAIENYSSAVTFSELARTVLPKMTRAIWDGGYSLYVSDPEKWIDATPASDQLPRITFGVDAQNILRKVHVEAPSALTTQGFELIGDFEFTDVNELVPVKPLPHARKVTRKNAGKLLQALFGLAAL